MLPVALFHGKDTSVTLKGGTNAIKAPLFEYSTSVLFPFLRAHCGVEAKAVLKKRGLFPKGGGEVLVSTKAMDVLSPFNVTERGEMTKVSGIAFVCGMLPLAMAEEMAEAATKKIKWYLGSIGRKKDDLEIDIKTVREEHPTSSGSFILLTLHTSKGCMVAASAIGEKGKRAPQVGHAAAEELISEWKAGGCIDSHLQDQIIIFMALAAGKSTLRTGAYLYMKGWGNLSMSTGT